MLAMTDKCCLARVSPNTVFYAALLSCATADVLCTDDCRLLAEKGNCSFYECVERSFPCGPTGYTMNYGHRYCIRFEVYLHELTTEGRRWMDAVRTCLMTELLTYYDGNEAKTCESIKSFAFLTHPHCYLTSPPGFCRIIADPRNYDALYHGYQLKDFYGDDWKAVWRQVQETGLQCGGRAALSVIDGIEALFRSGLNLWRVLFTRQPVSYSGPDVDPTNVDPD